MDYQRTVYDDNTVQVGDLGKFSMQAIYEALSHSARVDSPHDRRMVKRADAEDSDGSWTQEDDNGTFYFDMQKSLNAFTIADKQQTMTTAPLSKSQRRFVHATAQILRLGHASFGPPGKLRRMIIFKDAGATLSSEPTLLDLPQAGTTGQAKKRRRLERIERGFPCPHCDKVFDRASERTKHAQAHQPNLTSRFPCAVCGRGFRYPKDLRRHSRVHERAAANSGTTSLSSSYGSSAASTMPQGSMTTGLTADSRVPSDTSLAFNSLPASNNVSPALMGRSELEQVPELDLEPLMLGGSAWAGAGEWLYDPQLGCDGDGWQDEDFLEMAKVRK